MAIIDSQVHSYTSSRAAPRAGGRGFRVSDTNHDRFAFDARAQPGQGRSPPTNRGHEGDTQVWLAPRTWRYEALWPSPWRPGPPQTALRPERPGEPRCECRNERTVTPLLFQAGTRYNTPGLGARPMAGFGLSTYGRI
jgi:hypothetical protein